VAESAAGQARPVAVPKADLALIGREAEPRVFEYGPRDVALYALSVGAGPSDVALFWDGAPGGMRVLPSFALVAMNAVGPQFSDLIHRYHKVEAGERLRVLRPLEPSGRLLVRARVEDVIDKGSFALLVTRIEGENERGEAVFELECSAALLGSGGFGGAPARGAAAERRRAAVERVPDLEVSVAIPETQAALYQLNGVDDPLHVDAAFARSRGFSRPILHGPCTFGYATRILVEHLGGGDPARLREIGARFSAPVYPGDRLTIEAWDEEGGGGSVSFHCRTERGPVLTHGHALLE
jgi:acyl dehydratase